MKRNRIPFLALITILCGLFFLTACKKGPLSLDQQEELMTDVRGLLLNMEKQTSSWQLSDGKKEDGLCFLG